MTEETQIDPPWKAALRKSLKEALMDAAGTRCRDDCPSCTEDVAVFLAAVLPHMETAYRTGRMAGASASAERLAQKNLELSKKLRMAREAAQNLADADDLTDWQRGYRACSDNVLFVLDAGA